MFNLILVIIALGLAVALALASTYHGGETITEGRARAEAVRLLAEEQQIMAAVDLFNTEKHRWPADLGELVAEGYLRAIPHGAFALAPKPRFELISSAYAQTVPGWATLTSGEPIYATAGSVPPRVCQLYNLSVRKDDGILNKALSTLTGQCFGAHGTYTVVIAKATARERLGQALGADRVAPLTIDQARDSGAHWDVEPGQVASSGPSLPPGPQEPQEPELPQANLTMGVSSAGFGSTYVDEHGESVALTVANEGEGAATGLSVATPAGFTLVDNTCSGELPAGASCGFTIRFDPTQAQTYSGEVVISSSANTLRLRVSGEGELALPRLEVSQSIVDLGTLAPNTPTLSPSITLTNTGVRPATGLMFSYQSPVVPFVNNTCGNRLEPGATCTFNISFEAADHGNQSSKLYIYAPQGGSVEITARANIEVPFDATDADFGVIANSLIDTATANLPPATYITITNRSGQTMSMSGMTMVAPYATHMDASVLRTYPYNVCQNIAPGASCNARYIAYPPNYGVFDAKVKLTTNLGSRVVSVKGRFSGYTASAASATAGETAPFSFGTVAVGSYSEKTFVIRNTGKVPFTPSIANSFNGPGGNAMYDPNATVTVSQNNCQRQLDIADSCTIVARFSPLAAGSFSTTAGARSPLYIYLGNPTGFFYGAWSLNLVGTGVAP